MFPMVSTLEDLQRAREVVEETHIELEREGITHTWPLEIGIMIETPAAVMLSPSLARLDAAQACKLAGEVLEADTGVQVQEAARSFFTHNLPPELCP